MEFFPWQKLKKNNFFMRCIFLFLLVLVSLEAFAQDRDSIKVYFLGSNKKGECYRVYDNRKLVLDFKTNIAFMHVFKVFRDTTLRNDMDAFRSIRVFKKKFFGYRPVGGGIVYLSKKYLVIRRDPKLRSKFSIEYFWTDDEPKNPYWRP
jgi:hypothetical protein